MSDDFLTPEQIEEANHVGQIVTKMFVYHNNGKITSISTKPDVNLSYIEVPLAKVTDFLNGKKSYNDYSIDYFLTGGKLTVVKRTEDQINLKLLYILPKINDLNSVEMYVVHNIKDGLWEFKLTQSGKILVESQNLATNYYFFVTKFGNPHYLYRSMYVTGNDLVKGVSLPFEKSIELDENAISISIVKKFNSCGYIVNV